MQLPWKLAYNLQQHSIHAVIILSPQMLHSTFLLNNEFNYLWDFSLLFFFYFELFGEPTFFVSKLSDKLSSVITDHIIA